MLRHAVASLLCLLAAGPALAGDKTPRLVPGGGLAAMGEGARFAGPESRAELLSQGGFSLGAVLDSSPMRQPGGAEPLALGAYAAYAADGVSLSSSLRGDAAASAADVTARYAGALGTAAVTLGYAWPSGGDDGLGSAGRPAAFSLNPWQGGAWAESDPAGDPALSLSVSFTHDVTSALHLGGFAAAIRSEYEDRSTEQGFKLGAGFGVRF